MCLEQGVGSKGFPDSSVGKESACNAGDPGSIPGERRSAGEAIGYPLQYSGVENSMDCPWDFAGNNIGVGCHFLLQARILEWVTFPFSRGSSQPWDRTQVSCTAGRFFIS